MNYAILNILSSLPGVPPNEAEEIARLFVPRKIKKKELLLKEGDLAQDAYFIVKGMLRDFITGSSGREVTTHFATENSFLMEPGSLLNEVPAVYSIQALEESAVLSLSRENLFVIFDQYPSGNRIGRLLTEIQLVRLGQKHLNYRAFTSEERFENFNVFYPNVLERAPSYMVASFLGISRATLHRLQTKRLRK